MNRSGCLFRETAKAECISKPEGITPSFYNAEYGAVINTNLQERDYPQLCFDYIHCNPVKAGLVAKPEDWEFSSYRDYYGMRKGTLINRECSDEFGIRFDPKE
jgi:putative transposase